jgi:hypothetical protein
MCRENASVWYVCLFFVFWPIHYYGRALKLCYTVKMKSELRRKVFVYQNSLRYFLTKRVKYKFYPINMRNKVSTLNCINIADQSRRDETVHVLLVIVFFRVFKLFSYRTIFTNLE